MSEETIEVKVKMSDFDVGEYFLVDKNEKMKVFHDLKGNSVSLNITIKDLEVKYLPVKYEKIVFIADDDNVDNITDIYDKLKDDMPLSEFIKVNTFSAKVGRDLKENVNNQLKQGDFCDIVVCFNGFSFYEGFWYPLFVLKQFRKVKKVKKSEKYVNYFAD